MIAVLDVLLTRGTITSSVNLREVSSTIYPNEVPIVRQRRAHGIQRYIAQVRHIAAYTCLPDTSAQAVFLWRRTTEFEVIIETFYNGNLLRISERMERAIRQQLNQDGKEAKINIELKSVSDALPYIRGCPTSLLATLWDALQRNVLALFVAITISFIAKNYLEQYYQESIAAIISILLFTFSEAAYIWYQVRNELISWRIV